MNDMKKVRKAHKVYTNKDGVLMCEIEHSKYVEMEKALTKYYNLKNRIKKVKKVILESYPKFLPLIKMIEGQKYE